MTIRGEVIKVYKEAENGWSAFRVQGYDGSLYGASGICTVKKGQTYDFEGDVFDDPKWGFQIKVINAKPYIAPGKEGILAFLGSGAIKGIGQKTAERIMDMFGADAMDVIKDRPEELTKIRGITKERALSFSAQCAESEAYLSLYNFFGSGLSRNQASRLIAAYGNDPVPKIRENPYRLIEDVDGFGFKRADELAKSAGISETSPVRIRAALIFVLEEASGEGDCFLARSDLSTLALDVLLPIPVIYRDKHEQKVLTDALRKSLLPEGVPKDHADAILHYAKYRPAFLNGIGEEADALLKDGTLIDDGDRIYWAKMYGLEREAADRLTEMSGSDPLVSPDNILIDKAISDAERRASITFAPAQREAVAASIKNRVHIITGGPGRGKTTIILAVIGAWRLHKGKDAKVVLCAPTGKAAKRMTETTGVRAYTIHMLIAQGLPLEGALLIADESSMLDLRLAVEVLRISRGSQLVLVGDADQLPPIGPGLFFRDAIRSGKIPCTRLSKGFRSATLIARNAEEVLSGRYGHFGFGEEFCQIECTKEELLEKVLEAYGEERKKYGEEEVCVLMPMKKNAYGTSAVNEAIRDRFGKSGRSIGCCPLRVGDRIMQTVNDYGLEWETDDGRKGTGIFNGECGKIAGIDNEGCYIVLFDDGRRASYTEQDASELTLSFALTIHKSQGSEYDSVILAMSSAHYYMGNRSLFYTAMTRARKRLILIGDRKAIWHAITNNEEKKRNTRLAERIAECMGAPLFPEKYVPGADSKEVPAVKRRQNGMRRAPSAVAKAALPQKKLAPRRPAKMSVPQGQLSFFDM